MTLQADHFRFFTSSHSRPLAATINTTMMLHGVDEAGSSLGGDCFAASDGLAFAGGKEMLGTVVTADLFCVIDVSKIFSFCSISRSDWMDCAQIPDSVVSCEDNALAA